MSDKKKSERALELKEMQAGLKSKDAKVILKTLKTIHKKGDVSLITPMLKIWADAPNELISKEIDTILKDLKDEEAVAPLVAALEDEDLKAIRPQLVSIFWQSRLDASRHLQQFVDLAISGNYMESLETLTVIENMEGPFEEEELLDAMVAVKQALEKNADSDKKPLLEDIMAHLMKVDARM